MKNMTRCLFLLAAFLAAATLPAGADERVNVIVDNYTGYALAGMDPVSYFTSPAPTVGVDEFEQRWGGLSWRFASEGNRRAFMVSPQVYLPQFGGYDPLALTRGVMTEGDPTVFLIHQDKLYLFFSVYSREDFMRQPARTIRGAAQGWRRLGDGR